MSCQLPFTWSFLLRQSFPYSTPESACYGTNWAHNLYGVPSPCDSKLVRNVLEAAKRELAKTRPVVKKEPVTPEMIWSICSRFAGPNANLSDLRLAAICVTAYSAFVRYNELASLRCCVVRFCDTFVKIYVLKSKTFIRIAPMFCWQNLTLFLALFTCLTDTLVPLI